MSAAILLAALEVIAKRLLAFSPNSSTSLDDSPKVSLTRCAAICSSWPTWTDSSRNLAASKAANRAISGLSIVLADSRADAPSRLPKLAPASAPDSPTAAAASFAATW